MAELVKSNDEKIDKSSAKLLFVNIVFIFLSGHPGASELSWVTS